MSDSKRVICAHCKKTYASASSLSTHKKICKVKAREEKEDGKYKELYLKQQTYVKELEAKVESQNTDKKFVCTFCNRSDFSLASGLSKHKKYCGEKEKVS